MSTQRKFIIDTDAGIDDTQAIFMALSRDDVEVIAITICHGNAPVDQVAINVTRILEIANKIEIPVYKGCSTSLLGTKGDASFYHGNDGLGDCFDQPPDFSTVQSQHAVNYLVDAAQKFPGEVTVVCLAPLTNVAMATRMNPNFSKNLKDCYIMGGNYEGKGNITSSAEFNFHTDPEAADIVLREFQCPVTLACWELCLNYSFPWDFYWELRSPSTPVCSFLKKIETYTRENSPFPVCVPCDEVAMAIAINPEIVAKSQHHSARVELHGSLTRGQVVIERKPNPQAAATSMLTFVYELDKSKYHEMLRSLAKHEFV